ncbi:MAG: cryptochrome/photolyase family protein, partial [Pseudomonadota bacterium]
MPCETLVLVLGDQLSVTSPALRRVTSDDDGVLMMEVHEEATYVPQHKIRLALFFSAMRHFREDLRKRGYQVSYSQLDDADNGGSIEAELTRRLNDLNPKHLVCVQPGDHRVQLMIETAARRTGTTLEILDDPHFITSIAAFQDFAEQRKSLLMEYFYRDVRRKTGILMYDGQPVGGQWNFDHDNRDSFGKSGPPEIAAPLQFHADDITRQVIAMVEQRFPNAPGRLEQFDYPVTREDAHAALVDFVDHRLRGFGRYQDAMAMDRPYLYHSRLSAALNMHLLDPRDTVASALEAFDADMAELNSVEGFVRQIIGWREFVRGIYWTRMPGYADANELAADLDMPEF